MENDYDLVYQYELEVGHDGEPIRVGETPCFSKSLNELSTMHKIRSLSFPTPDHLNLIVNPPIEVSRLSIMELESVSLKKLRNCEQCKGKYVILRVVEMPYPALNSINTVVEDQDGTVAMFTLYNTTAAEKPKLFNSLPAGVVFYLKEPFCTEIASGECTLWCEHPSSVVFAHERLDLYTPTKSIEWRASIEEDPFHIYCVPHNVFDWYKNGSTFCDAGNFEYALRCYFLAYHNLREGVYEHEDLKRKIHKAFYEVYFELGYYENAIKFAKIALRDDDADMEATFYAGLSCYHLEHYEVSAVYFEECVSRCPTKNEYAELLKKAQLRIKERSSDEFNITDMFLSGIHQPHHVFQRADFKGLVKIEEIQFKGRGVLITADITPGSVLCISKAFVYIGNDPKSKRETWEDVVIEIGQMMYKNPVKFGPLIYSLHDGSVKDIKEHIFCDSTNQQEPIINMKKLRAIVRNNAFGDNMNIRTSNTVLANTILPSVGCGLFDLPSYFNHSCLPNSSVFQFNDIIIVRAIKNINEGEEATIPYISWEFPYNKRLQFCKKRGFKCCCKLCDLEEADCISNHKIRSVIFDRHQEIFKLITADEAKFSHKYLNDCTTLINNLKDTYKNAKFPQIASMAIMHALRARIYAMESCDIHRKMDKEMVDHLLTLEFLGFQTDKLLTALAIHSISLKPPIDAILDENALYACSRLTYIFSVLDQPEKVSQWRQLLRVLENAYSGGNTSLLKYKYDHIRHLFELTF